MNTLLNSSVLAECMEQYYIKNIDMYKPIINNYTAKVTQRLILESGIKKEDKIFEVGCGLGRFTLNLAKSGYNLTIMDSNKYYTKINKRFFKPFKNVRIVETASGLKNKFDYVIGFNILHHVDIPSLLNEMKLLLKKDGKMVFMEPNPYNILYYLHLLTGKSEWKFEKGYLNLTRKRFKKLTKDYRAKIKKFGFIPPPLLNNNLGLKLDNILEKFAIPKLFEIIILNKND